jgi:hypothetical protein
MKNKLIFFALLFLGPLAFGQTILTNTTLSASATSSAQVIAVTSATNINAPNATDSTKNTFLVVDAELISVKAVSGTQITVIRGVGGTAGRAHASGAVVLVEPAYLTTGFQIPKTGSCTRTNELALPIIGVSASRAVISDCLGGQWVNGDATQTTRAVNYEFLSPNTGAQASTSVFGTNSTTVQYDTYCTEVDLPYSKLLTGAGVHIGTTGGTDLWVLSLYDSGGNLIANSAVAGATVGTGYAYQQSAFTSKYYAVGPAQYFACITTNGTTATLDTVTTAKGDHVLTKSYTGTALAPPATLSPPTAFVNVAGPYAYLY